MTNDRKPLISGNWKMHHHHFEAIQTVQKLAFLLSKEDFDAVDAPGVERERHRARRVVQVDAVVELRHGALAREAASPDAETAVAGVRLVREPGAARRGRQHARVHARPDRVAVDDVDGRRSFEHREIEAAARRRVVRSLRTEHEHLLDFCVALRKRGRGATAGRNDGGC